MHVGAALRYRSPGLGLLGWRERQAPSYPRPQEAGEDVGWGSQGAGCRGSIRRAGRGSTHCGCVLGWFLGGTVSSGKSCGLSSSLDSTVETVLRIPLSLSLLVLTGGWTGPSGLTGGFAGFGLILLVSSLEGWGKVSQALPGRVSGPCPPGVAVTWGHGLLPFDWGCDKGEHRMLRGHQGSSYRARGGGGGGEQSKEVLLEGLAEWVLKDACIYILRTSVYLYVCLLVVYPWLVGF